MFSTEEGTQFDESDQQCPDPETSVRENRVRMRRTAIDGFCTTAGDRGKNAKALLTWDLWLLMACQSRLQPNAQNSQSFILKHTRSPPALSKVIDSRAGRSEARRGHVWMRATNTVRMPECRETKASNRVRM
jgi:hypothetical protein